MKRFYLLLVGLVVLLSAKGVANCCNEPCANGVNNCSPIKYSLYADYLYWTANRIGADNENFDFSTDEPTLNFPPAKYSSGYRVGGAIFYHENDLNVRYTSFKFKNQFRGDELVQNHLNYQSVDIVFGYSRFFQCQRGFVRPYFGAKMALLKEARDISDDDSFINRSYSNHAYGPMIGVEGRWKLFQCWTLVSLVGRGDISIVRSHFKFTNTDSFAGPTVNIRPLHGFLTVADIFVGLGFDFCPTTCFNIDFQIGYESQTWHGVPNLADLIDKTDVLGLGGLVARLGVIF